VSHVAALSLDSGLPAVPGARLTRVFGRQRPPLDPFGHTKRPRTRESGSAGPAM